MQLQINFRNDAVGGGNINHVLYVDLSYFNYFLSHVQLCNFILTLFSMSLLISALHVQGDVRVSI